LGELNEWEDEKFIQVSSWKNSREEADWEILQQRTTLETSAKV
jgi:hypothetical protein